MGVHEVYYYLYPHSVGLVNELLELVGGSEARGNAEKIGAVISERAIVGVFDDSHYLDHIIA